MTDSEHEVQGLAAELASQLARHPTLDPEAKKALESLKGELDQTLQKASPEREVSGKARTFVERFEGEHPELTALVQRIADALSAAGL